MDKTYRLEVMEEIWKDILGYEGLYQVSNIGRVRSLPRNTGNQYSQGCIKNNHINRHGYSVTTLVNKDKGKIHTIHRLVAVAFIDNPLNKPQVNHIDGVKENNHFSNLEWCDAFANQKHRYDILGHITHNRELSKEQVFEILSQTGKGWRTSLSNKLGVSEACIKAVRSGRNYKEWFNEYKSLSVDEMIEAGWIKLQY